MSRSDQLKEKWGRLHALALIPLSLGIALFVVACASDEVGIALSVRYDSAAQAAVEEAINSNSELTIRFTYTSPDLRNAAGSQLVRVQPRESIATGNDVTGYFWETASSRGYDFDSSPLSLTGIPLGLRGVKMSIEILRAGAAGLWYPIAYYCTNLSRDSEELTADLLKVYNNQTVTMQKGRACMNCNPQTYVTYDSTATDSDCVAGN